MKIIKTILIAIMLISALPTFGQTTIWINGTVYGEKDSVQSVVPFATVKLYSDSTLKEMAYFAVCGPQGNYTVKPYDHTKSYYIVAESPKSAARQVTISPIPEIWDNKPFSGNATTNICVSPVACSMGYENYILAKDQFSASASNLNDILLSIDGIAHDDDGWFTTDERSVLFCINGNVAGAEKAAGFNKIPKSVVSRVTVYDTKEHPLYGKAIDITLTLGSQAQKPDYWLTESSFFINP